jgi:hypothetical protein
MLRGNLGLKNMQIFKGSFGIYEDDEKTKTCMKIRNMVDTMLKEDLRKKFSVDRTTNPKVCFASCTAFPQSTSKLAPLVTSDGR